MKRLITVVAILLLIPVYGYSQEKKSADEDVKITINISKISKGLGKIVKFIGDEAKQFKDEAAEGITEEEKQYWKDAKKSFIDEMKYAHDAIHQGWKQGWKGEDYTPPYERKK